jgi:hypothetical protein
MSSGGGINLTGNLTSAAGSSSGGGPMDYISSLFGGDSSGGLSTGGAADTTLQTYGAPGLSAAESQGSSVPGLDYINSQLGSNITGKDLLKTGMPLAELGVSSLMSGASGSEKNLRNEANTLNGQANTLESYLNTGTLPAAQQASLDSATQKAKAQLRNSYGQMGLSGSTMEAQALSNVDTKAQAQAYNIAAGLYKTGLSEAGMSNSIYEQLMKSEQQQDQALSSAISKVVSGMVGI